MRSDVVDTFAVSVVEAADGFVTAFRTTCTVSPAPIASPENNPHRTTVDEVAEQSPMSAVADVVVSNKDELFIVVASVPDGNVIVIELFAASDNPPVDDAVNPTVYTVNAPAAADGGDTETDTPDSE